MGKSIRTFLSTFVLVAFIVLGLTWWYQNLSPRKKQFVQNLVSQVPDLPARFMV